MGYTDFLQVAIKEAKEETGINTVTALTKNIVSVDILPVYGHVRRNKYISAHLHLSIAYVLIANGKVSLIVKKDENSDVTWFSLDKFTEDYFDVKDVYLYNKLIHRTKQINNNRAFY
ncbi:NUDIX domain-containing protein [Clostridium algidicarnis]|uniref:NUDIX domain-containing protein n=1 Tax=Clostridium algidicarnis TaxID=37659 RepID=UPI0027E026AC|nr:NUDIX domain-containing protein [Clostridium algidicarnis]